MPLKLLLHIFRSSSSSNKSIPLVSPLSFSSGGNSPFLIKLSKCIFSIPSIPEGRLGNIPAGLFQTACWVNQKHRGHSWNKLREEGESLNVILFYPINLI